MKSVNIYIIFNSSLKDSAQFDPMGTGHRGNCGQQLVSSCENNYASFCYLVEGENGSANTSILVILRPYIRIEHLLVYSRRALAATAGTCGKVVWRD